jgi:hypothetical protein
VTQQKVEALHQLYSKREKIRLLSKGVLFELTVTINGERQESMLEHQFTEPLVLHRLLEQELKAVHDRIKLLGGEP